MACYVRYQQLLAFVLILKHPSNVPLVTLDLHSTLYVLTRPSRRRLRRCTRAACTVGPPQTVVHESSYLLHCAAPPHYSCPRPSQRILLCGGVFRGKYVQVTGNHCCTGAEAGGHTLDGTAGQLLNRGNYYRKRDKKGEI